MFYFSYAANLNRVHMARLCPGAEALFPAVLENYTLTVRRWFNIEPNAGSEILGGVWQVGEENIRHLDRYEDCPGLYERKTLIVKPLSSGWNEEALRGARGPEPGRGSGKGKEKLECFIYLMNQPFAIPLSSPDPEYLEMVRQGYNDWGILSEPLEDALKAVSGL